MTEPTEPAEHTEPAVEIRDLEVSYGSGRSAVRILHGVSVTVARGHTVGVVGESGSGKSTLARTVVGTLRPTAGSVRIAGTDVHAVRGARRKVLRRAVQLIPQDPYSSLDPRRTIGAALAEALDPRRANVRKHSGEIAHWLETVRLPADMMAKYPHECSGGQRQRVAIARGLMLRPEVVIADEITSALDVSIQAEILELIAGLRAELGLTMLFISHNLAVVRQVSDEVVVLYRGDIVEQGPAETLYTRPEHPYTRKLLDSVPGAPGFDIEPREENPAAAGVAG
ncbi:dipeptide/oligopeptide/nickel ABC transporter ATP-binding protein [Amycolatopsis deserti]|uniref:Dipeptide/oligopeptide/nickel ABC transporter ATP-binding protein n=1 Tax=Amycolatopsis deserti TaxID=185696 RepID=A0ABQ3IKK8_9PSEU|nr:ABC transporter ATP-binding protein [Amycolatopsis deserti]GHE84053.1 dipeptide/oligopeptide/nickel ABC transporter ATP-binding protein [Amycolatopsis deserti]